MLSTNPAWIDSINISPHIIQQKRAFFHKEAIECKMFAQKTWFSPKKPIEASSSGLLSLSDGATQVSDNHFRLEISHGRQVEGGSYKASAEFH